jgi:hypothetical protein
VDVVGVMGGAMRGPAGGCAAAMAAGGARAGRHVRAGRQLGRGDGPGMAREGGGGDVRQDAGSGDREADHQPIGDAQAPDGGVSSGRRKCSRGSGHGNDCVGIG